MIVLAWFALILAVVVSALVIILVREAGRDEGELHDAELTRRLEADQEPDRDGLGMVASLARAEKETEE